MIEGWRDRPPSLVLKDNIRAHYDELDRFYRDIWGEHVHHGYWAKSSLSSREAVEALTHLVANTARLTPGQRVCDVGCGYGGTARMLARYYGVKVHGYTLSRAQYEYALAQGTMSGLLRFQQRDIFDNEEPDGYFDAVIAIESLEHMDDKGALFQELKRLLKPRGRFVATAWASTETPRAWESKYLLEPICRESHLPSLLSGMELRQMMETAGLTVEQARDISSAVKKTWGICAVRLLKGLITDRAYRSFLMSGKSRDRVFALTVFRMMAAYNCGAMRYWIFSARS